MKIFKAAALLKPKEDLENLILTILMKLTKSFSKNKPILLKNTYPKSRLLDSKIICSLNYLNLFM